MDNDSPSFDDNAQAVQNAYKFLAFCQTISTREQQWFNFFLVDEDVRMVDLGNSNFHSEVMRSAYMYKYGGGSLNFMHMVFKTACHDPEVMGCLVDVCSNQSNLKFCSLSPGPGLDIIAFVMAFYEDKDRLPKPRIVNLITRYESWEKTLFLIFDELGRDDSFPQDIVDFRHTDVITDDVLVSGAQNSWHSIARSSVVFMVNLINMYERDAELEQRFFPALMDIVHSMSEDAILFVLDYTASVVLLKEVLSLFDGRYLFEPHSCCSNVSWIIPRNAIQNSDCLPVLLMRGTFMVWKKTGLDRKDVPVQISRGECSVSSDVPLPFITIDKINSLLSEQKEALRKAQKAAQNVSKSLVLFLVQLRQINILLQKRLYVEKGLVSRNVARAWKELERNNWRTSVPKLQKHLIDAGLVDKADSSFNGVQFSSRMEDGDSSSCSLDKLSDFDEEVAQAWNPSLEPGAEDAQSVVSDDDDIPELCNEFLESVLPPATSPTNVGENIAENRFYFGDKYEDPSSACDCGPCVRKNPKKRAHSPSDEESFTEAGSDSEQIVPSATDVEENTAENPFYFGDQYEDTCLTFSCESCLSRNPETRACVAEIGSDPLQIDPPRMSPTEAFSDGEGCEYIQNVASASAMHVEGERLQTEREGGDDSHRPVPDGRSTDESDTESSSESNKESRGSWVIYNPCSFHFRPRFFDFLHQRQTGNPVSVTNECDSSLVGNIKRILASPIFDEASSSSKSS